MGRAYLPVFALAFALPLLALLATAGCRAPAVAPPPTSSAPAAAPSAARPVAAAPATSAPRAALPPLATPEEGCDKEFPRRLWPVMAENPTCAGGDGVEVPVTGHGAAAWLNYGGCGSYAVFESTPTQNVRIVASGDGCGCEGCVLWHVNYDVEELDRRGFYESKLHVAEPDEPCLNGKQVSNTTVFQPSRERFRIHAQSDPGFYFTVCGG